MSCSWSKSLRWQLDAVATRAKPGSSDAGVVEPPRNHVAPSSTAVPHVLARYAGDQSPGSAAEPQQLFTWGQFSLISSSDAKIRSSSRVLQRTKPLPWHCHQRWHSGWDNWVQRGEKYQNENELGRRWWWWGSRASWERAQQSGELSYTSATLEILLSFLTNGQRYLSQNFINLIDRNQQRRGICKEAFRACEQVCKNGLLCKCKVGNWEIRTISLVFPVFFLFSAIFLESLKYVSWDMILVFRKQPRGGRALQ